MNPIKSPAVKFPSLSTYICVVLMLNSEKMIAALFEKYENPGTDIIM